MSSSSSSSRASSSQRNHAAASDRHVVVAGGGLVGSLTALNLAQLGFHVTVIESRPDSRKKEYMGGRSINLALSQRGLRALSDAGCVDDVTAEGVKMYCRFIHHADGSYVEQPYGREDQFLYSVPRQHMNEVLMSHAEKHPAVEFLFECKVAKVDLENASISYSCSGDNEVRSIEGEAIFGCDGAFSAVRYAMQKTSRFNYQQDYLPHGYKELCVPPLDEIPGKCFLSGASDGYAMKPSCLHIWPRKDFMMIGLPNKNKSFTMTLFMAFDGEGRSFSKLKTKDQVLSFFKEEFPDVIPLMPTLLEDFFTNPTSSLCTIRCSPFHYGDKAVLLGDAAHAVVPFYGQGCNAGFEDSRVLKEILNINDLHLGDSFRLFTETRKENADAIADLALYNYKEMRASTASRLFLYRKKLERILLHVLPESVYLPMYSMVTFSDIPYKDIVPTAKRQDQVIDAIIIMLIVVIVLLISFGLKTSRFSLL